MKRLLTLVLALAMVLPLAACGSKKPVQLTADGGAVVVLSADANNAVTSLSVAFRKQLAAKLGGEVQLNYDNKLDEKASGTRVLIGQTSQAASTALYAQLAQAGGSRFGLLAADGCLAVGGTNEYLTYEALDYLLTTILGSGGAGQPGPVTHYPTRSVPPQFAGGRGRPSRPDRHQQGAGRAGHRRPLPVPG